MTVSNAISKPVELTARKRRTSGIALLDRAADRVRGRRESAAPLEDPWFCDSGAVPITEDLSQPVIVVVPRSSLDNRPEPRRPSKGPVQPVYGLATVRLALAFVLLAAIVIAVFAFAI